MPRSVRVVAKNDDAFLGQFPYRRKWTQDQTDDIFRRFRLLADAMSDAVGPMGQQFYLPPELLQMLALHISLAGGTVEDRLAYIVSRPVEAEADKVVFADAREWVLKQDYEQSASKRDSTAAMAKAAAEKIRSQLPPEVLRAVAADLAARLAEHTPKPTPPQEIVAAHALESELRDQAREDDA